MTDYTNLRKIVTGDIIIKCKCRLGNEIRRIPINQAPTYDDQTKGENTNAYFADDNDITHAVSISNLLKITVYENTPSSSVTASSQSVDQIQTTLTLLRDQINDLIKSLKTVEDTKQEKQITDTNKQESSKPTRKLTSAELGNFFKGKTLQYTHFSSSVAQFLSDDHTTKKMEKNSSPVKELTTVSPKLPSKNIPYYPPPSQPLSQPQTNQSVPQQPTQQQPVQQQQHQPVQQQQQQVQQQTAQQPAQQQQQQQQHYIQTPASTGIPPTPTSQQQQHPQQHQRPVSLQHSSQSSPYPLSIQHPTQYVSPNYPPPPPPNNTANDPRLQQQQQQQQQPVPPKQGYYVPLPPSSMNQTPQLPPQPYNPHTRW
ncbi:hypothetical protein HPULCUR_004859 [Helicostylum pulchrum]|uniref:Uncharacterized protein n=1 Tax=Helicostylum pulchrum TaxID=562976 RepID=A0ABP9XXG2_9FUNG